jgi:hypothetical protein
VKPRYTKHVPLPVIAVAGDEVLTEAGEVLTLAELIERLPGLPSSIFAATGAADLLAYFDEIFAVSHPANWQWRATDKSYRVYGNHPDALKRRTHRVELAVNFFGFRDVEKRRGSNRFHKLIDPVTMYGHRLSKVCPGNDPEIVRVLRWAITLRDFCAENNLQVRSTMGGISSQLLTDPRFYPNARRKVPAKTNQWARENLPGNHYRVVPSSNRDYTAYELDQRRAHHHHASYLAFPHADHLYAYGDFLDLSRIYRDTVSDRFMGLYCLDLLAPEHGWYHSWLATAPRHGENGRELSHRFVYTNELPHLLDMGYRVLGVRAAWGSTHRDTGLNKLAVWCCEQLDHYGDPRWLKPLLLSTYGTLACRPTDGESIFRLATSDRETLVLTGRRSLKGKLAKRPVKLEPRFVNVIQRGMIEAATRSESVGMTQYLEHLDQRVLHIYADAVFVELNEDNPLPLLPEPWRLRQVHTHYQPEGLQAYTSDQATKRPGDHRPRDNRMVAVRHRQQVSYMSQVTNRSSHR